MSIQHIKKILESKKKKFRVFSRHFGFWPAPKYFILFEYSLRIKMICRMKNDEQNFITKWKCLTFEKFRWHARNFTTARTTTTVPPPTTVSPPINILQWSKGKKKTNGFFFAFSWIFFDWCVARSQFFYWRKDLCWAHLLNILNMVIRWIENFLRACEKKFWVKNGVFWSIAP